MEGLGDGVEESVFFGVAGDGRTAVELVVGDGGGVGGERCVEGCGQEVLDWLFALRCLSRGWMGVLCGCIGRMWM